METSGEEAEQGLLVERRARSQRAPASPARILVVGDDLEVEQELRTLLGQLRLTNDIESVFLHSIADAETALSSISIDVLLAQTVLADGTSAELFERAASASPATRRLEIARSDEDVSARGVERWKRAANSELRERVERLLILHRLSVGRAP